ncbi:N-6 DNA methylase [Roseiflexus castenholzii]|uniref:N-6 DNA methylase n=1 Tax=Roseiflexus castenholzii TaxID=120962 RepID=UPI003C7B0364
MEGLRAHASGNGNPSTGIRTGSGKAKADISIYGQELNDTTWRLATMNLAIRGIEVQIAHSDTVHNDRFLDLKADFILPNPPPSPSPTGAGSACGRTGAGRTACRRWPCRRRLGASHAMP